MEDRDLKIWRDVFEDLMEQVKPGDAWKLTVEQNLEFHEVPSRWKRVLQKHICAKFTCSQCHRRWTSHQGVILFHLHWERSKRQGEVKMKFFDQQCHKCNSSKYEEPQFMEETILNVLAKLVFTIRKKCYREQVEDWDFNEVVCQGGGGPHKEDYCEACQLGIHKGHSETPQFCHDKTYPWEPQLTRNNTWSQGKVSQGTSFLQKSQHIEVLDAISEGETSPGHSETIQDGVCHGKTYPWELQLTRNNTWSQGTANQGTNLCQESQHIEVLDALSEGETSPGHSETIQDGVCHDKTYPWELQFTRNNTWSQGTANQGTKLPEESQHIAILDASSEIQLASEQHFTSSLRLRGRIISCVAIVIIVTAHIIVLIGFLKNWY